MRVTSSAANYHRNGNPDEPCGRAAFEFTGEEVAEALLKRVKETSKNPVCDVYNVYVRCPDCKKTIGVDELKVSLVVNFY